MIYDDEDNRKDFRRKKIKNQKEDVKKMYRKDTDIDYVKIKNQFKQKKRFLEDQDTLDELEDYT